jgi:hypothetical protein
MRIVGNLQGPTRHSRDIPLQAKGITGIESTQIRWFYDDQAAEAGPVEHSSAEAKSLKLEAKGLSGFHPSGQQPRQPDGGGQRPNKGLLSQYFIREHRALGSFDWKHSEAKGQKKKDAYSTVCSNLEVAEWDGVGVD